MKNRQGAIHISRCSLHAQARSPDHGGMKHTNPPPWSSFTAPTLAARRRRARLARSATAALLCLTVFGFLYSLDAITGTDSIVTATAPITRGATIRRDDVAMTKVPSSSITGNALHATATAVGSIAQHHIETGQPLYDGSIGDAPALAPGHTVLDVAVANNIDTVIAGDIVSLVSAFGCEDGTGQDGLCTVAEQATVMKNGITRSTTDGQTLLSVAITPESAIRVMKAGESGALIAVQR